MEKDNLLAKLMAVPMLYDLSQFITGGYHYKKRYIASIADHLANKRVLDIGCGTGFFARTVPKCDYLGIDFNQDYIDKASATSPDYCKFLCGDASKGLADLGERSFDAVITAGLFHHLPYSQCEELLKNIVRLLDSNGQLFGFEPAYTEDQSKLARYIISKDRGSNVLTDAAWKTLFEANFDKLHYEILNDALIQPYTLIEFQCIN